MWASCVICGKDRLEEVGEEGLIRDLENEMRNGEICMYFLCDLTRRWLKNSSLLCYILTVLNMGGRVGYVM
jgi:hypothetical protein